MKIGAKIVLSGLPISYHIWNIVGIFKHGGMMDPEYATNVFHYHFDRHRQAMPTSFNVLELGPGDSVATSLIASACGADNIWLVDISDFVNKNIEAYLPLQKQLGESWTRQKVSTVDEMLRANNSRYLTNGLASLRSIPDSSVDFVFSQAVLQSVSIFQFEDTLKELYRIQRPGSIASHQINLSDFLANNLHSLRFSQSTWESPLFAKSGFYTNRLRASQLIQAFENTGYQILERCDATRPILPLSRRCLHPMFAHLNDNDFKVRGMYISLQKPH